MPLSLRFCSCCCNQISPFSLCQFIADLFSVRVLQSRNAPCRSVSHCLYEFILFVALQRAFPSVPLLVSTWRLPRNPFPRPNSSLSECRTAASLSVSLCVSLVSQPLCLPVPLYQSLSADLTHFPPPLLPHLRHSFPSSLRSPNTRMHCFQEKWEHFPPVESASPLLLIITTPQPEPEIYTAKNSQSHPKPNESQYQRIILQMIILTKRHCKKLFGPLQSKHRFIPNGGGVAPPCAQDHPSGPPLAHRTCSGSYSTVQCGPLGEVQRSKEHVLGNSSIA